MDEKNSVAIKLLPTFEAQQQAMAKGLRRLLILNVPSPIKYLQANLPNKAKLSLYFAPFGKVQELIDDCIAGAVDKLMADFLSAYGEKIFQNSEGFALPQLLYFFFDF